MVSKLSALNGKLRLNFPLVLALCVMQLVSCGKDSVTEPESTPPPVENTNEPTLSEVLESELINLANSPLDWSEADLSYLDPIAGKRFIAMGEATHGTSEFFDAKFRVFRYLVENHGFRVFGIEADFGESLLINDAIQRGAVSEIEGLMQSTMVFWTWRTEEVQRLLEWMAEYNIGKPAEERLQYFGFDAQFNQYNPGLLLSYLDASNAPFLAFARDVLNEATSASDNNYNNYTQADFEDLQARLGNLQDSLQTYETELTAASSAEDFLINQRAARVVEQASQVLYAFVNNDSSISYRDQYMAENARWAGDFYNAKSFLWAHNAHVAKDPTYFGIGGAMGRVLQSELGSNYYVIGFLFSQGTFTAVTQNGSQFSGLDQQSITTAPKANSFNAYLRGASSNSFSIAMRDLSESTAWQNAFANDLEFFHIGAVYNNNPLDYYRTFNPFYYDEIIYLDRSTATRLLPAQ